MTTSVWIVGRVVSVNDGSILPVKVAKASLDWVSNKIDESLFLLG